MSSLPQVVPALQHALQAIPMQVEATTGFCHRRSKCTAACFVQTLVFGWLSNPAATLVELTAVAADQGIRLSPQALDQRFGEPGATVLEAVLAAMVAEVLPGPPVSLPLLQRFGSVRILDSSTIRLPDALADWVAGCGGSSPRHTQAAIKLGVGLDLADGRLDGPYLSAGRQQDKASVIQHRPVPAGGLRIADRGFWSLKVLANLRADAAHFLSYLPVQTVLLDPETQQRRDLMAWLEAADGPPVWDVPVLLGATHQLPARLIAMREPEAVASDRRRRIHTHARHKGKPPSTRALARAGWTLMVTSLAPDQLTPAEAVALLRARWQIELLFKCWKEQLQIDLWRSANPARIRCEVLAKLIGAVLQHWVLLIAAWQRPDRSWTQSTALLRGHALAIALALNDPWTLRRTLQIIGTTLATIGRISARPTRPATFQLLTESSLVP